MNFGALSRGFGTCCLRFKNRVATIPAKLASGWLARLYREGVEPSGPLQKVSDHILVPLFWIYPGAMKMLFGKISPMFGSRDRRASVASISVVLWTGAVITSTPSDGAAAST